jgi:membrane protein DedA with SNARE-associated domain
MTLAGFLLGKVYPKSIDYLHFIIIALILVTLLPVASSWLKERRKAKLAETK